MKRSILIGSIFVCFLMLMTTTIGAVEFQTILNNGPDIDDEELKTAILQRIEELKISNPKPCWTFDDPDGPFEGGLDDWYDWKDLIYSCVQTILLTKLVLDLPEIIPLYLELITSDDVGSIIAGVYFIVLIIFDLTVVPIHVLQSYGDAFDIIDPDENGY
jgi:hypothetical protein